MRRLLPLCWVMFLFATPTSFGAQIGYQFSGIVTFASPLGPPYGIGIPAFTPVNGQFVYDTVTSPVAVTNGSRYLHHLPGGFSANFGSVSVSANDYLVEVLNDAPQPDTSLKDIIRVYFASNAAPLSASSLMVNSTLQSQGLFSVNLMGSSSVFTDSSLPTSLALSNYPNTLSFFADTPTGTVDTLFTLNSLTVYPVPEPAGGTLLALGALAAGLTRLRFRKVFLRTFLR